MNYIAIIITLLFTIHHQTQIKPVAIKATNSSRYAIFKYNKKRDQYCGFDKDCRAASLSATDITKIEELISEKVNDYNKSEKKGIYPLIIHHPKKYYKQLIAVINSKEEKEVWVCCSCSEPDKLSWKKEILIVEDGGSCYFRLKINLTKNAISSFNVNGEA